MRPYSHFLLHRDRSWRRNRPPATPYRKPTKAPLIPSKYPKKRVTPPTIGQNINFALLKSVPSLTFCMSFRSSSALVISWLDVSRIMVGIIRIDFYYILNYLFYFIYFNQLF